MLDFDLTMSTKIFFGKNKISTLGDEIKKFSTKILLTYGNKHIKESGLLERIIAILKTNNIDFIEFGNIPPNPTLEIAEKGVKVCQENDLDFVLAIGGGSVIDCSKAIAAGVKHEGNIWELYTGDSEMYDALPIATVLTVAAAGSETNEGSVLTNEKEHVKLLLLNDLLRPKFSVLDPSLSFTVSKEYTAISVADIYSHILEMYFCKEQSAFLQDRLLEALFKTCIEFGPVTMTDPENYEARANVMWVSSLVLNGFVISGKIGDWSTHMIAHELSATYNITHGLAVSIITPYWMEYVFNETTLEKFYLLAVNVWGIEEGNKKDVALEGIEKTKLFFQNLGLPSNLSSVGIDNVKFDEMAKKIIDYGETYPMVELNEDDVKAILVNAL